MNHCVVHLKLTQYCKSTISQFLKNGAEYLWVPEAIIPVRKQNR